MFSFTPGGDPFGQQGAQQGDAYGASNDLVGRVMAMEYTLAVQRGDAPQAAGVLASMFGQFLNRIFSR